MPRGGCTHFFFLLFLVTWPLTTAPFRDGATCLSGEGGGWGGKLTNNTPHGLEYPPNTKHKFRPVAAASAHRLFCSNGCPKAPRPYRPSRTRHMMCLCAGTTPVLPRRSKEARHTPYHHRPTTLSSSSTIIASDVFEWEMAGSSR